MAQLSRLFKRIKVTKGNTLYYPGCLAKFASKEIVENYKKIFNYIGIDFIMLKDFEFCCGKPISNSGHKKEAKELAEKNFKIFKDHGITKIITSCPSCYEMFLKEYKDLVPKWDIDVENATVTIFNAIEKGKLKLKKNKLVVTYHDPCHLGRYCEIYDEPRNVIKLICSELREMKLSRNYSYCCGAGAGVKTNYPSLSSSIAKERIKMAEETGASVLVTPCSMCYLHLKEKDNKIDVKEFGQFIVENMEF
ncbi:MAG TPA: (Fe-S)-binding protein [Candidatus Paceibacterota bacterium]|nr:(Fe-S)-binding protein [Candidatus Paceibacterota bacterium]